MHVLHKPTNKYWNTKNLIQKLLKKLKFINELRISNSNRNDLKDEHFDAIDLYLLHLRQLSLITETSNYGITDKTLKSLEKLQKLTELQMSSRGMTVRRVENFIRNSPNIKTLELREPYINSTTIEAIIERLNKDLKNKFLFSIYRNESKREFTFNLTVEKNLI